MKKSIAAIALVLGLGFTAKAQEAVTPNIDPNAPVMQFESEVLDYGTVKFDGNGVREFKVKNTGKSPLTITNVQGQCGCTSTTIDGKPGWPQEPVLPGKSAAIRVKYDTKRPGPFEKNVTVTSNAKEPSKVVKIKGVVEAAPAAPAPAAP
ncbi:MAG: DUF1573 domain-containing protein [Bacteroidia bacterium]|jgi:hypothetical protein|nr:DUF1573 domain-containing protein [Bacteroidia bacterium]